MSNPHQLPSETAATTARSAGWLLAAVGATLLGLALAPGQQNRSAREVDWLTHLAQQGDTGAQIQLGLAYHDGRYGLTPDHHASFYWLKAAAKSGDPYAEDLVATAYAEGDGVVADRNLAEFWWEAGARSGNADAERHLGELRLAEGDKRDAEQLLKHSADQGDPKAVAELAVVEGRGRVAGTHEDLTSVGTRMQLGAMEGVGKAVHELMAVSSYSQDPAKLKQLASAGDAQAQFLLAMHYRDGAWGVTRNAAQALYWLRQSASGGNHLAMAELSEVYSRGELGTHADPQRAARWAVRAQKSTS